MEAKPNKMWMDNDIAFLLLQATPSPCPHQFIDHKCKTWNRMRSLNRKQKIVFLMQRQSLSHLLRFSYRVVFSYLLLTFSLAYCLSPVAFPSLSLQCGVSLSVICPKQLPKLKSIYNAVRFCSAYYLFVLSIIEKDYLFVLLLYLLLKPYP